MWLAGGFFGGERGGEPGGREEEEEAGGACDPGLLAASSCDREEAMARTVVVGRLVVALQAGVRVEEEVELCRVRDDLCVRVFFFFFFWVGA